MKKIFGAFALLLTLSACQQKGTHVKAAIEHYITDGLRSGEHLDTLVIKNVAKLTAVDVLNIKEDTLKKDVARLDSLYSAKLQSMQTAITALAMLKAMEKSKKDRRNNEHYKLMVDTVKNNMQNLKNRETDEKNTLDSIKFAKVKADTSSVQDYAVSYSYIISKNRQAVKKDTTAIAILSADYKVMGDKGYLKKFR